MGCIAQFTLVWGNNTVTPVGVHHSLFCHTATFSCPVQYVGGGGAVGEVACPPQHTSEINRLHLSLIPRSLVVVVVERLRGLKHSFSHR